MIEQNGQKISRALVISGIIFTVIIWLDLIIMLPVLKIHGTIPNQFSQILSNPFQYKIGFIFASLIGPFNSLLMIIFAFLVNTKKTSPLLNIFSIFLLVPYLFLTTIAYTSQYTYFISLLHIDHDLAKEWYFGKFDSFCKLIHQLGYLFFAISGILLGYRFCFEKGIKKIFGLYLEIRCVFYVIAFVGLVLKNQLINSLTLFGLLLTLFFGMFAIIIGINIKKESL